MYAAGQPDVHYRTVRMIVLNYKLVVYSVLCFWYGNVNSLVSLATQLNEIDNRKQLTIRVMKKLLVSALMAAVISGNTHANIKGIIKESGQPEATVLSNGGDTKKERIEVFKSELAFHLRNVEVLWNQYDRAVERVRNSRGNHADLDRDKAFFIAAYQKDIDAGVREEASRKAIQELESHYKRAHIERADYETKRIARLQVLLKAALEREVKGFETVKRRNAQLINPEILLLLEQAEEYFATSMARVPRD